MENKDIISISANCAWPKGDIFNKERNIKHMLCGELAKYIEDHFDELPINHKISDDINYSTDEEIHKVTIDLANNLVPVTLDTPNGQITAYISKDVANTLDLNNGISQIVLKKKLTYGDLYNKFIEQYPVNVYDWRPAGKNTIEVWFNKDSNPVKIIYDPVKDDFSIKGLNHQYMDINMLLPKSDEDIFLQNPGETDDELRKRIKQYYDKEQQHE